MKYLFSGTDCENEGKKRVGSLIEYPDGKCVIVEFDNNGEELSWDVIPESVELINKKKDMEKFEVIKDLLVEKGFYKEDHLAEIEKYINEYPNFSLFCQEYGEWVCLIDKGSYCMDFNPHGLKDDRYIEKPAGICYDYLDNNEPCCLGRPYEVGYNGALRIDLLSENEIKIPQFYVQETIGGWRQNAIFSGTLEECEEYMKDCYGNFAIVHEDDYEVDYL